jgi:hypothetical protein
MFPVLFGALPRRFPQRQRQIVETSVPLQMKRHRLSPSRAFP